MTSVSYWCRDLTSGFDRNLESRCSPAQVQAGLSPARPRSRLGCIQQPGAGVGVCSGDRRG